MSLSILNDAVRAASEKYFAHLNTEGSASADATFRSIAEVATNDATRIRNAVRAAHETNIRFVIWTGPRQSVQDKFAMQSMGLLKGGPMFYALDSSDPQQLKSIVDDMQQRAQEPIAKLLPATLVVMDGGDGFNSERLVSLFERCKVNAAPNFVALSGSAAALALAGRDLKEWTEGAVLTESDRADAGKLAAFLHAQAEASRDKVTLFLPRSWTAAGPWTKDLLEDASSLKVVIGERFNGRTYRKPSAPNQDRLFLAIQRKSEAHPEATGITAIRAAGYPIAFLTFAAKGPLSRYMSFMRLVSSSLRSLSKKHESPAATAQEFEAILPDFISKRQPLPGAAWWRNTVGMETPESLAGALRDGSSRNKFSFAEMIFFGDMRYSEEGNLIHRALETGAQRIFRVKLRMPVDIAAGPGSLRDARAFSLLIVTQSQARFATAGYEPDRNIAQFFAAKAALERSRRIVRAILVKDLSTESIAALEEFFTETAALLEIQ